MLKDPLPGFSFEETAALAEVAARWSPDGSHDHGEFGSIVFGANDDRCRGCGNTLTVADRGEKCRQCYRSAR